ncbi:MAG: hypothetical protein ACYC7D_03055 [Nitrososphaerales archaeon]
MTSVHLSPRREAVFLNEFGKRVEDSSKTLNLAETNSNLKGLVRERKNYGDSLLKAGAILLIIPDPITDAAAVPVLAAGKILSSRQSSALKDIYTDLSKALTSLSSISSSL